MSKLTPNYTYSANGVTVYEKIIPDGTRWKDGKKAANCGFSIGSLYKAQRKLCGTGAPKYITVHNTNDLPNVYDDGEQYTRATYNENMHSSRVHFYADDVCAWQNLKAGTGMTPNDPKGLAEVGWHAGDGTSTGGGNETSISIEIIMNDTPEHDAKAKENGARLVAYLMQLHGLTVDRVVSHTYWVNRSAGKSFADVDEQCTNYVAGKKWCPTYIFGSTNHATALKNWKAFKAQINKFINTEENEMTEADVRKLVAEALKAARSEDAAKISELEAKVAELEKYRHIYHWYDQLPDYARETITRLHREKVFEGAGPGDMALTEDMMRILLVLVKQGVIK